MKIKQTPNDFIVEEIPNRNWQETGAYHVYKATKTGLTTQQLIQILATQNNTPTKNIRYAGLKDKHATTTQYLTSKTPLKNNHPDINLEHIGYTDQPLHLGELTANKFHITVHDIQGTRNVTIPNYYGDQRFGTNNVKIGIQILKGDLQRAAETLATQYPDIKLRLGKGQDAAAALHGMPLKTLLLYVHSVQSWLWNEAVSNYLREQGAKDTAQYRHGTLYYPTKAEQEEVPLVGAAQDLGKFQQYYEPLLQQAGLSTQDFLVRKYPQLTLEGGTRTLLADIKEYEMKTKDDTAKIALTLGPGCYATVCVHGWCF